MEPILNKQEIADLLHALKEGQVSLDLGQENQEQKFKNCSPVNLFQVNELNDELSRLPNFDIILDNFSQNFAISLTNHLQRNFSIQRSQIESAHFLDFLLENKDVGAIAVLDVAPLKHGSLILVDANLCFSLVEVMLGASTEIDHLQLDRKLTSIELKIIHSIIAKGCEDLNRAFAPMVDLDSSILKVESNSRLVSITEADAEILVASFNVNVGEIEGQMKMVFPIATLDPLREELKELLNVNKGKYGMWTETLEEEISCVAAELIAQSGVIKMSVNDILNLEKGDTLFLDYNPNSPLQILVENKPKFYAIPGTHNGKKAISISGVHAQGD